MLCLGICIVSLALNLYKWVHGSVIKAVNLIGSDVHCDVPIFLWGRDRSYCISALSIVVELNHPFADT